MEPIVRYSDIFTATERLEQRTKEDSDELLAHALSEACELIQALCAFRVTHDLDDMQAVHDELADVIAYTLLAAHPNVEFDAAEALSRLTHKWRLPHKGSAPLL